MTMRRTAAGLFTVLALAHAGLVAAQKPETKLEPTTKVEAARTGLRSALYESQNVSPERARKQGPFGGTIAHGYLTLSLYPLLRGLVDASTPLFPGVQRVINYGLDKLRFPNAVRAGSRVRARCVLLKVGEVPGGLQMSEQYTVEIDGESKPACVAEAIMRVYF